MSTEARHSREGGNSDSGKSPSPTARAEAAAWIARLHGPNRTPEAEEGFRRWLAEDPERAVAFELLTDTWEKSARLRRRPIEAVASWERPGFRVSFSRAALASATVAVLAVIGTVFFLSSRGVTTGIGEQRTLTLDDGSRVYLNTDTQAVVQYDDHARRIELRKGEAFFEVAKRPEWPFIVVAGDREIRAVGTSFVVRRDEGILAVTLVEGKVTVTPGVIPAGGGPEEPAQRAKPSSARPGIEESGLVLSPGERLTIAGTADPKIDKPPIDKLTAWQRGQVALDHTALADAVAEMNRYSRVRLVIEDPSVAAIRVSGIFRAGDSDDFARAVAKTYHLYVVDADHEIILSRPASEQ